MKVLLCVTVGFLTLIVIVVESGYTLVKKHKKAKIKAAHEAQVKENLRKAHDDEYVQAQMMDYLEERYHGKFVMKSYNNYLGGWYGNYVEMRACPEGKDDEEHLFIVEGYPNDEGNLEYFDTFVLVRLEKRYVKFFEPIMDEYFEDYYSDMYFWNTGKLGNISADVTVEELLELGYCSYAIPILNVVMNPEQGFDLKNMELFCRAMQAERFRGLIRVCDTGGNEEIFKGLVNDTYRINENDSLHTYQFSIKDDKITISIEGEEIVWD